MGAHVGNTNRGPNWNMHDSRLIRNLVGRDDLSPIEIVTRFNQRAKVPRSSSALGAYISNNRFVIADHHNLLVGGLPTALRALGMPAERVAYTVDLEDDSIAA